MRNRLFSFSSLYKAYIRCRKNKRTTDHAAKFETNFESELAILEKEISDHTYKPGLSICFAISDPKLREVWAADFRDRIVHHLLVSYLEPIWEKKFIFHSYACRKEKGAHLAIRHLKKCDHQNLYFLQMDIQSFFVSIDKNILSKIIERQNELDQFIKHSLKCRRYFRYMDDMLILDQSKEKLLRWRENIKIFLETTLKLKLHPNKQTLQSTSKGINFCGYIVRPGYLLIRKRTVKRLKNNLRNFNQKVLKKLDSDLGRACDIIFDNPFIIFDNETLSQNIRHAFSSINSVYGFFKHANCYNLRKSLYEKHFGILKIYLKPVNKDYDYFIWKEYYYGG